MEPSPFLYRKFHTELNPIFDFLFKLYACAKKASEFGLTFFIWVFSSKVFI